MPEPSLNTAIIATHADADHFDLATAVSAEILSRI
jgi:hypothetical protein